MNLKRLLFIFVLPVLFLFFIGSDHLFSGVTGKIAGTITDTESGVGLPGVNVVIIGSNLGAATNGEGNYTIIGVPPGVYQLKISMMGYKEVIVENVRVSIDLTTWINSSLNPTVLETEEVVTIVAERPLVQMDMTSSLTIVGSKEIEMLPAQSIEGVVELQAGVVNYSGLHIRGGRSGEIAYWVDGVATTDVFDGGQGITVENSAVEELQVVSGTFNAEYGRAMSGIINIITKEGSPKFSGQIKGYVGDYLSGDPVYEVLERSDVLENPSDETLVLDEAAENPVKKFNPIYNGEISLSGPVPFTNNKLSFFTTARYFTNEGYLYGRDWYRPQGIPGDSSLVPMNPYQRTSAQVKFTWHPVNSIKLAYNIFWNDYQIDKSFWRTYKYNPGGVPQQFGGGLSQIFTLNHVLSANTFYEIRVNRFRQNYESYVHKDPSSRPHWLVHVLDDSGIVLQTLDLATEAGQAAFNLVKQQRLNYRFFVDPNNSDGYVHPDSARDPAAFSFYRAGNSLDHFYRKTDYWVGKLDFTSQLNQIHQVKAGIEFRTYELYLDSYTLQAKREPGKDEQIVPFTPEVPAISTIFHDQYTRNPREFAAYLQDKIELKDMIVNVGLRLDYFDANSVMPADPADPNIYDPFKDVNIYKNPDAPEAERQKYTPEERRTFMHKKVDPKMQLSPRLGIAYPITDKGMIHFSYGHFFQIPEFQFLYDSPDFKMSSGGGRTIVGNADLNTQKTVQYEIGLAQQLTTNIGIDLTLFYRDIRDWVGTSPVIKTVRPSVAYVKYENKDYANVRGINIKLEKRMSDGFSGRIDYGYQVAEGTYSNPNDAFYALQANQEPRLNLIPLNWDQRQSLNAQFLYQIKGWTATLVGKLYSGTPYTPSFAKGERVGGTALSDLRENSGRKPTINSYDIYLTRRFELGRLECTFFTYLYNIFDQRGESGVFSDTGTATYTTFPILSEVPLVSNRVGTVEDLMRRPEWFIAPRQIQIGLTLGF